MKNLNNQIPNYQEFCENYEINEQITQAYQLEQESWDSEKSIGCGNSQSSNSHNSEKNKNNLTIAKTMMELGLEVLGEVCPATGIITRTTMVTTGLALNYMAEEDGLRDLADIGLEVAEAGKRNFGESLSKSMRHSGSKCSFVVCPKK